jgi:DNA repair exonuclease SbcCD nuclease subunit
MKIAIISDTHWGIRNDNSVFLDNNKKFLDNVFFPYLEENKIDIIIHMGDIVDRRKYININTAKRLREDFLEEIEKRGLNFHLIIGNHDTYFKNTNDVNIANELLRGYNNFFIYHKEPVELVFDGTKILFIPWICEQNRKASLEKIQNTDAQIAMGHLEISGFEMYKGSIVSHGDDRSLFGRFDIVFSGHFHHRSTDGTIFYQGSHSEFTWSDYDDQKGFQIFDTKTREINFIKNPYTLFKKVWYNDSDENNLNQINYEQYRDSYVKVVIQEKNNLYLFDKFIESIEAVNPIHLQVVEDNLMLNLEDDQEIINEAESTIDIFRKYIESIESKSFDKAKLESKIFELYNEAINLG